MVAHLKKNKQIKFITMNNSKFKTLMIIFGATLFISSSSFGQSQNREERKEPPTFSELLEKMDTNEDGKLSTKEVKGPLKKDFSKIDTDEDGFITKK
jgi:Ca2+-binding EF-hand superfamily protein